MTDAEKLEKLFDDAKTSGGMNYLYTLVRVEGITRQPDPILKLRKNLTTDLDKASKEDLLSHLSFLGQDLELLRLFSNLLNCLSKQEYQVSPFIHLYGSPHAQKNPSALVVSADVISKASRINRTDVVDILKSIYTPRLEASLNQADHSDLSQLRDTLSESYTGLRPLLSKYFERLQRFKDDSPYAKLRTFEVIKLLVDPDDGLYGFEMYFSTGGNAKFSRKDGRTEAVNLSFNDGIGFQIGDLEAQKKEWRVGQKRLYEVGLEGRYNEIGHWRPLSYPTDCSSLQKRGPRVFTR
jgi:hypothetical protein